MVGLRYRAHEARGQHPERLHGDVSYTIRLPTTAGRQAPRTRLDIVDGVSSAVQRMLRTGGLACYEPSTMATLLAVFDQQRDGFTFFDVGANVGLYASVCASLFRPGTVVAFEPTPDVAAIARRIAGANDLSVHVEELALSDAPGEAQLFLSATSDTSNSLAEGFKEAVGALSVRVDTIDRYRARTGRAPGVVKLDAETYEPQVIRGGRRTIEELRPVIVVEVLNRRGHDHGEALTEEMDGSGYWYYPIRHDADWSPSPVITGRRGTKEQDWLLAPEPLPYSFGEAYRRWQQEVRRCSRETNSRLPLLGSVVALHRAQGAAGVWRALNRRLRLPGR